MSQSDPIADMLSRIRNGLTARHATVASPASKLRLAILEVLKSEGYIRDYHLEEGQDPHKQIIIELKYSNEHPVIKELQRVSKPGRRCYSNIAELPKVYNGLGILILSTSKGVMSDHQARQQKVGGEILCKVF
jgi:small subunit ribosomal protein S8